MINRAHNEGIKTFTALMLADNRQMRDLLEGLGPGARHHATGTVEVEVPVSGVGVTPELRDLLSIAARHDVAPPLTTARKSTELGSALDSPSVRSRAEPGITQTG